MRNVESVFYWFGAHQPEHFVRHDITWEAREALAEVLGAGAVVASWMGRAACRMCGQALGATCLSAHGFRWPAQAEHYVLVHSVWPPYADALLRAARHKET